MLNGEKQKSQFANVECVMKFASTNQCREIEMVSPEFADAKMAHRLFCLSRTHLYQLADAGKISSVVLRREGALRGRRLFVCESIRKYLNANIDGGGK